MTKHFSTLEHNVWLPYRFALGPVFYRWFEGLKEEKIWGSRCPQCKKVLVPARSFCPECNQDMDEWVELSPEGRVVTWTLAAKEFFGAPAHPPLISALIRLDGADCELLHLIAGFDVSDPEAVKQKVKKGARVRAVWNEEKKGSMLDLEYFEPI